MTSRGGDEGAAACPADSTNGADCTIATTSHAERLLVRYEMFHPIDYGRFNGRPLRFEFKPKLLPEWREQ
jgi:hypothetical protein